MKGNFIRIIICICVFGLFLYAYLEKQNELTKLKILVPEKKKEMQLLLQEVKNLQYEVDLFENPTYLMEIARSAEFSHLKHPLIKDVLSIPKGVALKKEEEEKKITSYH